MQQSITDTIHQQKAFFQSGATKSESFRQEMLTRLRLVILKEQKAICNAVFQDLHKSPTETYLTEIGILLDELRYVQKHLHGWMQPQSVRTPLTHFPAHSSILHEPYGTALIIAPWNYPVQLTLLPLIGAISAGNCAVLKPSEYTPQTSRLLAKMIQECFPPEFVTTVTGGVPETTALLNERFDCIFFTGSPSVGKIVMTAAAKHLTPVILELGGKSPVIVDDTANLKLAARRIAFGKVMNAGQICVAPDYLLIDEKCTEDFLRNYRMALKRFSHDGTFSEMAHIISKPHFDRLCCLMADGEPVIGGQTDAQRLWIAPTVLQNVDDNAAIMQEEIFGPILPIRTYRNKSECIPFIQQKEKPLALYIFSQDKAFVHEVLRGCSSGGVCINDVIMHTAQKHLPFGGVGNAGMGAYHGKASFDVFSHKRSVLYQFSSIDIPMRYMPYSACKEALIRKFLR